MHSSKLLEVLLVMDKPEIRQLSRFLHTPFFAEIKQRKKAISLLEYILKYYSQPMAKALEKETVFHFLFPDEAYAGNKMDKLMARLLKATKKFIAYKYSGLNDEEIQELLVLAKFYRDKKLDKQFNQCIAQIKKKQRSHQQFNREYFFNQYLIEREITSHASISNTRNDDLNLPNTLKSLDLFYLKTKLEYACWSLVQGKSTPFEMEKSLAILDELLPTIRQEYSAAYPLIGLYFQAYVLLRKGTDRKQLEVLQKLLNNSTQIIPVEQLQALLAIYRSLMIKEYSLGAAEKAGELFALYQQHLEAGFLYYQGGIPPAMVRNIVTLGLKAKAYPWVEKFLKEHRKKIVSTSHPQEVYQFNLARYYFELKDYESTLKYLVGYDEDTYYKIAAKRLALQVYFETQSDLLEPKMTAFKVYIHRASKKILPSDPFKQNNNFINLLRQINSPQVFKNEKKIQLLTEKINNTSLLSERDWFLEKLESMR